MRTALIPAPSKFCYLPGMLIGSKTIVKITDSTVKNEGYRITIKDKITVRAADERGFFYADKTLAQIFFLYGDCIPNMIIEDAPKYAFRSFMIDSGRHFFKVDDIKKMIDTCAMLKFNTFHWHLTEDQGWRVQIDKYPELTTIGSVRHGTSLGREVNDEDYGGFYTKDEIRDVVAYAAERFIDVIPEFDIPGHVASLLAAMPNLTCDGKPVEVKKVNGVFFDVLCAGNEDSYRVVFDILDEMCELFPSKYFHIGGDEVRKYKWHHCEKCQAKMKAEDLTTEEQLQSYFVNRVCEYLTQKGKTTISWNETLKGGLMREDAVVQYWTKSADGGLYKTCKNPTVVSDTFAYYMDYPYSVTPLKRTYNYCEKVNVNVIGIESPIWTEFVKDIADMERMCFPRYIAVAQSAWSENKPNYAVFRKDLRALMGMFDTTNWEPETQWDPPVLLRPIKKSAFYSRCNNAEFRKKLRYDRTIWKLERKEKIK